MWAIYVVIFMGLYASPETIITEERFESKHACESYIEESVEPTHRTKDGDTYTVTTLKGDTIFASCGKINY